MASASASTAKPRLAVVLYGKIGNEVKRAKDGGRPSAGTIGLSAITTQEVLLRPLARLFRIDVFGHSWSAGDSAALITELWKPVRSRFEDDRSKLFERQCNARSRVIRSFPGSCGRTISQLLGMQRAIHLKAEYERSHGFGYSAVFVSRWDLVWLSEKAAGIMADLATSLARSPRFWLADSCATENTNRARRSDRVQMQIEATYVAQVCGVARARAEVRASHEVTVPTLSRRCVLHRACEFDLTPHSRDFFVMDMWFLTSSTLADEFATAVDSFDHYRGIIESEFLTPLALNKSTGTSYPGHWPHIFGHFFFGLHLFRGMRGTPVGWAPLEYRHEYSIARVPHVETCRPSRSQLLLDAQTGGALVVPLGFLANTTQTSHHRWRQQVLPLVEGAGNTPVATMCRVNPAFLDPPFGSGRAFVCPIDSPACEPNRLATSASRFYNLTWSTIRHPWSLVHCGRGREEPSSGAKCARTLHALWVCVHERQTCEHLFINLRARTPDV